VATPSRSTVARRRADIQQAVEDFDLIANANKLIANRVAPMFDVNEGGGNYGRIPVEQLLQLADSKRASDGSYNRLDFEFEEAFYQTKENGIELPVDERDKRLYETYLEAEIVAADIVRHTILVNRERRVADITFNNPDITATAGAVAWDQWQTATPIEDVEAAVIRQYEACGLWANSLTISYVLYRQLRNCEQILDRISASGAGDRIKATDVNLDMLAQVFDLDEVIVGGASQNRGAKGQSANIGQIWDTDKAMVATVVTSENDIRQPGVARSFHWAGDGSSRDGLQESYWEENCRAEIQRCRQETDERCTYPEAAQLLTGLST